MANISSNLQTLLDNRLRYLPPLIGNAIGSVDWASILIDIGRKFGMHMDEMEDFQAVVLKSMVGLIAPENFEKELISNLALSPANAEKVIMQVNERILEPIHDFVMRNGKPADALKSTGIVIEDGSAAASQGSQRREDQALSSHNLRPESASAASESLVMPLRDPEPIPDTLVAEKFEDYFITKPTSTDQTL